MAGNTEYKNAWAKENLDRISLTVPKGKREKLQGHAQAHGESLNSFINRAIDETIKRDQEMASAGSDAVLRNAVRLLNEHIPGFEEFYDSGQIPRVIGNRIIEISPDGDTLRYH